MRKFIIIAILFPIVAFGQLTDTTCIKSRWIALKPSNINKDIFLLDSTLNDTLDLVFVIKKLVEEKKLKIYTQNSGPHGLKGWYFIDYQKEMEENLKDSMSFWNTDPYFQITEHSYYPMVDEYGDPLVVTLPDGTQAIKYPPPNIYVFPSKKCDEIRIKEDWIYNEKTKKYEFVPVGLSFYFKGGKYSRGNEKFWVDLNQLFNAVDMKLNYPWYNALVNKKYQGFQYMQVSCYDDEIKN
jgi:hypothetical protein